MGPGYYAETEPKAGDVEGRINHVLRRAPAPAVGGVGGAPAVGGGGWFEFRACRIIGFRVLSTVVVGVFPLHCFDAAPVFKGAFAGLRITDADIARIACASRANYSAVVKFKRNM